MPNPQAMTAGSGGGLLGRPWRMTGRRDSETPVPPSQLVAFSLSAFIDRATDCCLAQVCSSKTHFHKHTSKGVSHQTKPNQAKPSQAKPSQAKPSQAKPSQAKPSQAKPNQTKPNQTKPNQTKPNQTKPNQTKPNQTKPNQTKPNQTKC